MNIELSNLDANGMKLLKLYFTPPVVVTKEEVECQVLASQRS
ncbi:hypothetical protein C408_3212 [Vibrio diabolicus E0666]|nr:hypothetical protein C408_3212 [Vibrio diabolicus E0666]